MNREKVVAWFSQYMMTKLKENEHKGGWSDCDRWWLLDRLLDEVEELEDAMTQAGRGQISLEEVIREAADVANFAMMIADLANVKNQQTI